MATIVKFFGGELGDIVTYFRCDLSRATSPLQHWDSELGKWVGTQYQCADARHRTSDMVRLCHRLMAGWCEVPEDVFDCAHEEIECFGYRVFDGNSSDSLDSFEAAAERIAEWYEDVDEWATGHSDDQLKSAIRGAIEAIDQPEDGGIDELQQYAEQVRQAVAEMMGGKDFHGHGNYAVSAADSAGLSLSVESINDPQ